MMKFAIIMISAQLLLLLLSAATGTHGFKLKKISEINVPSQPISCSITTDPATGAPVVAVGCAGGLILLYDAPPNVNATIRNKKGGLSAAEFKGFTHINAVSLSSDASRLIAGSTNDEKAIVWDLRDGAAAGGGSGSEREQLIPMHSEVYDVAFEEEKMFVIGDGDGKILVFTTDADTDKKNKDASKARPQFVGAHKNLIAAGQIRGPEGGNSFIRQISFFKDVANQQQQHQQKKILIVSGDFMLFVFDPQTGLPDPSSSLRRYDLKRRCRAARYSPSGETLCCAQRNSGSVHCKRVAEGGGGGEETERTAVDWEAVSRRVNHGDHAFSVDWLSENLLVTSGSDGTIQVTSSSTHGAAANKEPYKKKSAGDQIQVSPDKKYIASFSMFRSIVEVFEVRPDEDEDEDDEDL